MNLNDHDRQSRPRVPPGQYVTEKFPVLTYGRTPRITREDWRFEVSGETDHPMIWDWDAFVGLGSVVYTADFHCVTTWSRLDNTWTGVPASEVIRVAPPGPAATHVMVHCHGGYTTNLPVEDFSHPEVAFAYLHDGKELTADHGYPIRLIVPYRYAWKSAKWVRGIEYMAGDRRGFWENYGYHNNADPWAEERYG